LEKKIFIILGMKIHTITILSLCLLFISGCATTHWYKHGATQDDFYMAKSIAENYAENMSRNAVYGYDRRGGVQGTGNPLAETLINASIQNAAKKPYFDMKMRELGWEKQK
jgi:hypothetical protein